MRTNTIAAGTAAILVPSAIAQQNPYAGHSRYGGGAVVPNAVGNGYSTYGMSDHPSWPSQTGSALSQIIDGSSAPPGNYPTGPPAGVASSLSGQYGGNSYGPNNHPQPTNPGSYGPGNHPSAPVAGSNGPPAGAPTAAPASVSSWIAHSGWTSYGANNHPSSGFVPAGAPASVSSYFANSAWTTQTNLPTNRPSGAPGGVGVPGGHGGAGNGGAPFGPGGPNGQGYPSWFNTASGAPAGGACPPASWSGWTQGDWSTHPAWATWSGCTASQAVVTMQTTEPVTIGGTQTSMATVTETVVSYAGIAAVTGAAEAGTAAEAGAVASGTVASGSSNGVNVSAKVHMSAAAVAMGSLVVLAALL